MDSWVGNSGLKLEVELEKQPSPPPHIQDESYLEFLKPESDVEESKEESPKS
jgi:hypothetical protein